MGMKILVTPRSFGKTDPGVFEVLKNAGFEIAVNNSGGILDRDALRAQLADCDGVILGVDPLDAGVLAGAPKLKAIAKYGIGVDNIDLVECEKRGIKVSRTVGANADAVADYAFSLMMAVARQVVTIDARCRQRDWSKITSLDINGRTLGVLGTGAIGKGVVARAKGFSMRVIAHDVFWNDEWAKANNVEQVSPEEIYRQADFITLHLPLNDDTRGMIGADQLAMMKPTTVIVNTARGGIIDEDALLHALQTKQIYGAGIDAFLQEPPANPAWYALDNLVMGSHAAASTVGATENMGRMATANIIRDLNA